MHFYEEVEKGGCSRWGLGKQGQIRKWMTPGRLGCSKYQTGGELHVTMISRSVGSLEACKGAFPHGATCSHCSRDLILFKILVFSSVRTKRLVNL